MIGHVVCEGAGDHELYQQEEGANIMAKPQSRPTPDRIQQRALRSLQRLHLLITAGAGSVVMETELQFLCNLYEFEVIPQEDDPDAESEDPFRPSAN